MELIKLAANPRITQAAKKFHQECANAGIHLTKEVGLFNLLENMAEIKPGLASECVRVVERQTEEPIEGKLIDRFIVFSEDIPKYLALKMVFRRLLNQHGILKLPR